MEALTKPATYRYGDAGAAELMLIDIAVRDTGKARCGVSFPMHREDECEIIDRALETHVPERARKLESSKALRAPFMTVAPQINKSSMRCPSSECRPKGRSIVRLGSILRREHAGRQSRE